MIKKVYNLKYINLIFFFIILFLTFISFYSFKYQINFFYIFSYILSLFLFLFILKKKNKKILIRDDVYLIYIFPFLLSIVLSFIYDQEISNTFFPKFIFIITLFFFLNNILKNYELFKLLKVILTLILLVNISLFYIEFFSFYIFQIKISFFEIFTNLAQKGASKGFDIFESDINKFIRLKRFSGIYNEPGTYACVISLIISILFTNKSLSNFTYKVIIFSILTVFLSFSVRGFIYFFILTCYLLIINRDKLYSFWINYKKILILFLIIFLYFFLFYFIHYLEVRFIIAYHTYSNLESYINSIINLYVFYKKNILHFFLGSGIANELLSYKMTKIYNDNTLLIYIMSRFGVLYTICIFFYLYNKLKLSLFLVVFFVLLFGKLSFFTPLYLILLINMKKYE